MRKNKLSFLIFSVLGQRMMLYRNKDGFPSVARQKGRCGRALKPRIRVGSQLSASVLAVGAERRPQEIGSASGDAPAHPLLGQARMPDHRRHGPAHLRPLPHRQGVRRQGAARQVSRCTVSVPTTPPAQKERERGVGGCCCRCPSIRRQPLWRFVGHLNPFSSAPLHK